MSNAPATISLQDSPWRAFAQEHILKLAGHDNASIKAVREAALFQAEQSGAPTKADEAWRYAPHQTLKKALLLPLASPAPVDESQVTGAAIEGLECYRLVFAGGHVSEALSQLDALPKGITLQPLSQRTHSHDWQIPALPEDTSGPAQLAAALWQDGLLLKLPAGLVLDKPLHIITASQTGHAQHLRLHIELARDSRLTLLHTHPGGADSAALSNIATTIELAQGASLREYHLQQEGVETVTLNETHVSIHAHAQYHRTHCALGGGYARQATHVSLLGKEARCELDGAFVAGGSQIVDHYLPVTHAHPEGYSNQNYRGVLYDKARGVFYGRIAVPPHATDTEAHQHFRGLLLSDKAECDARPELEIHTDAVQCSHGVAIGQLEPDALYYLQARGLSADAARQLLVEGFLAEVTDDIADDTVRNWLSSALTRLVQR